MTCGQVSDRFLSRMGADGIPSVADGNRGVSSAGMTHTPEPPTKNVSGVRGRSPAS